MLRTVLFSALAFLVLGFGIARSQTIDPHAVFENRCSRCHTQHAGVFTRKSLTLSPDGQITGRKTQQRIEAFLTGHSGNPSPAEIAALMDMFAIQLRSGGIFEQKCRICHDSAKKLARVKLEMRNGRLMGWIAERDIRDFLKGHGRLDTREVEIMNKLLIWQLQTAGR